MTIDPCWKSAFEGLLQGSTCKVHERRYANTQELWLCKLDSHLS